MPAQSYVIVPDSTCRERVPLTGWQRLVFWLRRRPQPRFVWCPPNTNQLICHPSTVPWLKKWLEARGHSYTQGAPVLREAKQ